LARVRVSQVALGEKYQNSSIAPAAASYGVHDQMDDYSKADGNVLVEIVRRKPRNRLADPLYPVLLSTHRAIAGAREPPRQYDWGGEER